jgi:excisionase family DNA binding protein
MKQEHREGFAKMIWEIVENLNYEEAKKRMETRLTREEASKELRISLGTLDKRIKEGKIQVVRDGKRVFITNSEIARQIFGE